MMGLERARLLEGFQALQAKQAGVHCKSVEKQNTGDKADSAKNMRFCEAQNFCRCGSTAEVGHAGHNSDAMEPEL